MWIRYHFNKLWAHLLHRRKSATPWTKCIVVIIILIFFYGLWETYFQLESHGTVSTDLKWLEEHSNLSHFLPQVTNSKYEKEACGAKHPVVVAVISAPQNLEARRAIRSSWGKHLLPDWKLLFFVGKSDNKTIESEIKEESKQWNDLIKLDVHDSYTNLTLKIFLMFHWVQHECGHSKFLIKIDDDVYLSPHNIGQLLSCSALAIEKMYDPNSLFFCNKRWDTSNLLGHFIDNTNRKYVTYIAGGFLYKNVKADRNVNSKWYLSSSLYDSTYLPEFLSGTSYFMSTNLLPYILESAVRIPAINLEDLYFTGLIMRKSLNLKLNHIKGWNRFRPRYDDACLYSKLVTAHGLNPQELIQITENVRNDGNNCTFLMNLFSLFNEIASYLIPRYRL